MVGGPMGRLRLVWLLGALGLLSAVVIGLAPQPAAAALNSWTTNGPYSSDVLSLAIDPQTPCSPARPGGVQERGRRRALGDLQFGTRESGRARDRAESRVALHEIRGHGGRGIRDHRRPELGPSEYGPGQSRCAGARHRP